MFVYRIVEQVDTRKRASAASVLALLGEQRPELPQPRLGWFGEPVNRDYRQMPKGTYLLDARRKDGECFPWTAEIWIKATLNGQRLVEVVSHEFFHFAQPLPKDHNEDDLEAHELTTTSFGLKVARVLAPEARGLFLAEQYRHLAMPGDAVLDPHAGKRWVRTLETDGGWRWHQPLGQFELFVASRASVYQ